MWVDTTKHLEYLYWYKHSVIFEPVYVLGIPCPKNDKTLPLWIETHKEALGVSDESGSFVIGDHMFYPSLTNAEDQEEMLVIFGGDVVPKIFRSGDLNLTERDLFDTVVDKKTFDLYFQHILDPQPIPMFNGIIRRNPTDPCEPIPYRIGDDFNPYRISTPFITPVDETP